jgi:GAF domain-containing protein
MIAEDLESQVERLFPDLISESEIEVETETEDPGLQLERAVASLLWNEDEPEPSFADIDVPPPVLVQLEGEREGSGHPPEETQEEQRGFSTDTRFWKKSDAPSSAPPDEEEVCTRFPLTLFRGLGLDSVEGVLRGQRVGLLDALLQGLPILSGGMLVLLLIHITWQKPMTGLGDNVLYLATCMVALVTVVSQWIFRSSLMYSLQEAERMYAEAVHSQALLEKQLGDLAVTNAALQRRNLQLQVAAQISPAVDPELGFDEMIQQTVDLVRERLDLCYVGIFLSSGDESEQWAVLQAAAGEAGRKMVAQGYRLRVGDTSSVGWCIANDQARIVPDLGVAPTDGHVEAHALLPGSRSGVVLPLRSRGRLIGALDMRSSQREAFSQEDMPVLQRVAEQVAAVVGNARRFEEMRARVDEVEVDNESDGCGGQADSFDGISVSSVESLRTSSVSAQAVSSYERVRPGVAPLGRGEPCACPREGLEDCGVACQAIREAMEQRMTVVQSGASDETEQSALRRVQDAALVVPITLRGEILGVLGVHEVGGGRRWTDDEIALVEAVADQMALAIENACLLDETRQRAEQERIVANITAQVRSSMDAETILQTAVRELGAALGADRAFVKLGVGAH